MNNETRQNPGGRVGAAKGKGKRGEGKGWGGGGGGGGGGGELKQPLGVLGSDLRARLFSGPWS